MGDPKGDDGKKGFPGSRVYETTIRSEEEIPGIVRQIVTAGGNIYKCRRPKAFSGGNLFCADGKGGHAMMNAMTAIIKKDLKSVTDNRRMFASLMIVPLVLMIFCLPYSLSCCASLRRIRI